MQRFAMFQSSVALAVLALCGAEAVAAPNISRLTPPSNPALATANTLARFLPGQRFDLQATVQPDAGATITQVVFAVDGNTVATLNNDGTGTSQYASNTSLVKTGLVSGLASNTVVASSRAYANSAPGVHTLTVTATDSNGLTTTRQGSFEVVGITANSGRPAKNIIIMLGDGMGASHRTAARIMAKGYAQGVAQGRLAMDTFPYTGLVMTASLNSIVTDSAPGMSNYVNGNKAQNNQEGVFPDDTTDAFDNPRIEYLSEYLHRLKGTSLGIVTTADVFDATPAANAVHTSARGNGTGIVDQYLDDRNLTGLKVLMGGGRKWFLPNASNKTSPQPINGSQRRTSNDYVLPTDLQVGWGAAAGALDNGRDLIADFQSAGFTYAPDKTSLLSAGTPDLLLGLFSYSNMNVAFDKINGRRGASTIVNDYGFPDQPMLDEMTQKALDVLNKNNSNGFVLMVEGASIDKQAHLMDTDRWVLETIEFDRAVQKAKEFAQANPDTIVIVTADHECSGAAIIGASMVTDAALRAKAATSADMRDNVVGTYDSAKFPAYSIAADGYPTTTDVNYKMLIGYGANADRYEAWISNPKPTQDSQQPFVGAAPLNAYPANPNVRNSSNGYLVTGQVPGDQAAHTATDVPLSAFGRGASLFTGVFDNTDVFFKLGQIAIGGAR
ncbi:MAG: alkaline phosphatase [Burkholderiales bacterium]|uniref:alkaline phosphatase n=1 Tax=Roseateles sp. TaxID=1971397 RepID=UPI000F96CF67|nr:MAG: alkaline phosphatase [Burkholderiales bacterium]